MFESIDHLPKSTKASLPDESKEKKINLLPEDLRLDKNDKLKIKQLKKDTHFNYSQDGKRMQSLLNKLINAVKSKFARPPQAPFIMSLKKNVHPGAAQKHISHIIQDKNQALEATKLKEQKAGSQKNEDELNVNLLPKREHFLTDKQMLYSYLFIIIIGFLTVISPYVFYRTKVSQYEKDIVLLAEQNRQIEEQKNDVQDKIKNYGELLVKMNKLFVLFNGHIYWSRFFPTLEKHTVANLYFTSLDVDDEYHIDLQARALTLRDIAEQLVVFKNNVDYGKVTVQSININKDEATNEVSSVEAAFAFELNKKVIYQD